MNAIYSFEGTSEDIIFPLHGRKVMRKGQRYTLTVLMEDTDYSESEIVMTGEYRGLSEYEGTILFWQNYDSSASEIDLSDITGLLPA